MPQSEGSETIVVAELQVKDPEQESGPEGADVLVQFPTPFAASQRA